MALSREQVAGYLAAAGFSGEDLVKMVAIAGRESNYEPAAHRTDQPKSALSGDLGLFQINYTNWPTVQKALGLTDKSQLFDPAINAQAAKVLFDMSGLSPWTAGPGGWTQGGDPLYGTNMSAARNAVSAYQANPTKYSSSAQAPAPAPTQRTVPQYEEPKVDEPQRTSGPMTYTPPPMDPEQQKTLTSLLAGFGIEYPTAPRATPQLLAYLRGLGVSVDTAESQYGQTKETLERAAADSVGDLAVSDKRRRYNLANTAQQRGSLISGATNTAFARQAEDYTRDRADVERKLAEGVTAATQVRDQYLDSQRQQALERTIDTETSQAMQEEQSVAEVEAINRAREEADLAYARTKAEAERQRKAQAALIAQY